MKREELGKLGLTDEQVDAIMKMNGEDINREKAKLADYESVKQQLDKANEAINGMADYEEVKASVAKYQAEAETARKEAEAKVQQLQLQAKIKDFTSGKKFVNDLTRDAINAQLESALNDESNKGKSLDELLNGITEGKTDIFREENAPTPPTVTGMNGDAGKEDGVLAAFQRMNPTIKI